MNDHTIIAIVTDSITNSVFESQVILPLKKRAAHLHNVAIHLVSFERNPADKKIKALATLFETTYHIPITFFPLNQFWGKWLLKKSANQLSNFLTCFPSYTLVARGPLAGYIALHSYSIDTCLSCIIQARGILHEEYDLTHTQKAWYIRLLHQLRKGLFFSLEQYVYGTQCSLLTIEAVSPALKEYLCDTFNVPSNHISLANYDTPASVESEIKQKWRTEIRTKLAIPNHAIVYCYNGSIKPWQCPAETIAYFKTKTDNPHAFLLVLTQDIQQFESLIIKSGIPIANIRLLHVAHEQVHTYLSASDYGMIFRKPHIVNWTSRPTKLLEYQALGLSIIHNNTIAYCREPLL